MIRTVPKGAVFILTLHPIFSWLKIKALQAMGFLAPAIVCKDKDHAFIFGIVYLESVVHWQIIAIISLQSFLLT